MLCIDALPEHRRDNVRAELDAHISGWRGDDMEILVDERPGIIKSCKQAAAEARRLYARDCPKVEWD
jgi:hypothetical protein